jgi:hypothetical protein
MYDVVVDASPAYELLVSLWAFTTCNGAQDPRVGDGVGGDGEAAAG